MYEQPFVSEVCGRFRTRALHEPCQHYYDAVMALCTCECHEGQPHPEDCGCQFCRPTYLTMQDVAESFRHVGAAADACATWVRTFGTWTSDSTAGPPPGVVRTSTMIAEPGMAVVRYSTDACG